MAVPKIALAALGLGAVAFVATRKSKRSSTQKPTKVSVVAPIHHPICKKYPQGFWSASLPYEEKGYPPESPGWNEEDVAMAKADVDTALANAPQWGSITEAREIAFGLVRGIIQKWCPSMDLPSTRINVENYLAQSKPLRYMWETLDGMIWNRLVGSPGGGNN